MSQPVESLRKERERAAQYDEIREKSMFSKHVQETLGGVLKLVCRGTSRLFVPPGKKVELFIPLASNSFRSAKFLVNV